MREMNICDTILNDGNKIVSRKFKLLLMNFLTCDHSNITSTPLFSLESLDMYRGHIFSCVQPFYDQAVSDLDS